MDHCPLGDETGVHCLSKKCYRMNDVFNSHRKYVLCMCRNQLQNSVLSIWPNIAKKEIMTGVLVFIIILIDIFVSEKNRQARQKAGGLR